MSTKTTCEEYQEGKDYSQKVEEKGREIKFNWKGAIKWTVVICAVAGAYYYGKKKGAEAEARKYATVETPVVQETSEI